MGRAWGYCSSIVQESRSCEQISIRAVIEGQSSLLFSFAFSVAGKQRLGCGKGHNLTLSVACNLGFRWLATLNLRRNWLLYLRVMRMK
jgi:hypothetical protein